MLVGPRSALGNLILSLDLSSAVLCKQNLWLKCVDRRCALTSAALLLTAVLYFGSVSQDVTLRKVVIRTRELSPCSLRIGTCMYLNGESHMTPTYSILIFVTSCCFLRVALNFSFFSKTNSLKLLVWALRWKLLSTVRRQTSSLFVCFVNILFFIYWVVVLVEILKQTW